MEAPSREEYWTRAPWDGGTRTRIHLDVFDHPTGDVVRVDPDLWLDEMYGTHMDAVEEDLDGTWLAVPLPIVAAKLKSQGYYRDSTG